MVKHFMLSYRGQMKSHFSNCLCIKLCERKLWIKMNLKFGLDCEIPLNFSDRPAYEKKYTTMKQ